MYRIRKLNLIIFAVAAVVFILHCVKREHTNPLDPKYAVSGSGPAAPVLSIPKNGTTINDNTPLFDWSEVDRVGYYHLLVTDSNGITILQQNILTASDYATSNPISDGKYFWKVRTQDGQGNWGGWSTIWSFTIDTKGPNVPLLSIPTNGSTISDNKPSFDWNDVSDANIYEFLVTQLGGSGSTFITIIQDSSLTSSEYIAKSVLSDGKYFWKVRCRDKLGNLGGWSLMWSFTIGTFSVIEVSPDPLTFSNVIVSKYEDLDLKISNKGYATLSVTGITSTNTQFSVVSGGTSFDVSASEYHLITVRFMPSLGGRLNETLHITNNSSVNPKDVSLRGSATDKVATPTFSPSPDGTYYGGQNVTISCTTSGAIIHYTVNGSDPTESDQSVSSGGSVNILSTRTLKARAYKSDWHQSDVASGLYTIKKEVGTITDIDGNTYQTIKIGNQWWMTENLKVTHYRNGNPIPNVTSGDDWRNLTTGAYCNYNNDVNIAAVYGRYYNWYAVNDSRNIAPTGWHVPSDAEWKILEMYLGMSQSDADAEGLRGTDEGSKLKEASITHWLSPNTGATNESGFCALPGGDCYGGSNSNNMGYFAYFWSSTGSSTTFAWYRLLYCPASGYPDPGKVRRSGGERLDGFSVRCVKN